MHGPGAGGRPGATDPSTGLEARIHILLLTLPSVAGGLWSCGSKGRGRYGPMAAAPARSGVALLLLQHTGRVNRRKESRPGTQATTGGQARLVPATGGRDPSSCGSLTAGRAPGGRALGQAGPQTRSSSSGPDMLDGRYTWLARAGQRLTAEHVCGH